MRIELLRSGLSALLLLTAATICGCGGQSASPPRTQGSPDSTATTRDSLTITLDGRDSVSVLDVLRQRHKVEIRSTAIGAYVQGIDAVESGSHVYWTYTVNDSSPQIACDKYMTHTGDRIVWHLRRM